MQNSRSGTVILLKLYNGRIIIRSVKVQNVLNCSATELIDRLVIVTYDHKISETARHH